MTQLNGCRLKIIRNQDRPQFDQALQYPDMLYAVVSGMVQIYAQILLPTQELTHDGQARVTVVGATEFMSRNNRPANIPHPLEPIAYWCELDNKPSPSEYQKIVRPPRVQDPNMDAVLNWILTLTPHTDHKGRCKPSRSIVGQRFQISGHTRSSYEVTGAVVPGD
jgi:hypothetical protein